MNDVPRDESRRKEEPKMIKDSNWFIINSNFPTSYFYLDKLVEVRYSKHSS